MWKYYKSPSSFHFKPNKEGDVSEFKQSLVDQGITDDITDDIKTFEIRNICPLTGKDYKSGRTKFWNHILYMGLDPDKMDYEECMNYDGEVIIENTSKLMGLDMFPYIWQNYFKGKMNKKPLQDIIGFIHIDLLINLVKVYRKEITPEGLMDDNKGGEEKVEEGINTKQYTIIDLFAGTGAFSKAFSKYDMECSFANDFCKNSKIIFDMNHTIELTYGDLNDIKNEDIPSHNILCGGFSCQPFSIAGEQKGFKDERSNVFWKIISIMKNHSPEIVILENVKNLKSHDKGNTFKLIYDSLSDMGYYIKYSILNTSKITCIPQNRERIYIVCFKDKEKYDKFNFEFEDKGNKKINELLEVNIDDKYYYTDRFKVYESIKEGVTKGIDENVLYQYRRYYVRENKNNVCPTLTANMGGGGHNVPLLKDKKGIRRLTPRECFNLQGFPQDYKLPDVCDSALYKLAGNAVSVPVVELIAEKISKLVH